MQFSVCLLKRVVVRVIVLCIPILCHAQTPPSAPLPADQVLNEVAKTRAQSKEEKRYVLELRLAAFRQLMASGDAQDRRAALALGESLRSELRKVYGTNSSPYLQLLRDLAQLYADSGNPRKALETLQKALAVSNATLGSKDPSTRFLLLDLAEAQAAAGMSQAAEQTRKKAARLEQIAVASVATRGTLGGTTSQDAAYTIVPVHFKTTRQASGKPDPYRHFQGVRATDDTYGISYVSVPRQRAVGTLPHPSIFRLDFRVDPERHIIVKEIVKSDDRAQFLQSLRDNLQMARRKEVLIYVHGFNQSFINGVETAAGLAVDLELDGSVLAFSWPSKNNILRYSADVEEVMALRNQEALRDLITEAATNIGAERVFLVAHSMGNRLLLEALKLMTPAEKPYFDSIVFASPDVESSDFSALVKRASPLAKGMTLYAVDNDIPLWLSATLKEAIFGKDTFIRAGNAKANVPSTDFLDVVNATRANVTWLGHDSFAYLAKDDLRGLLWFDLRAERRCVLAKNGASWTYAPNSPCTSEAFQVASVFRRRHSDLPSALTTITSHKGQVYPLARDILLNWSSTSN